MDFIHLYTIRKHSINSIVTLELSKKTENYAILHILTDVYISFMDISLISYIISELKMMELDTV